MGRRIAYGFVSALVAGCGGSGGGGGTIAAAPSIVQGPAIQEPNACAANLEACRASNPSLAARVEQQLAQSTTVEQATAAGIKWRDDMLEARRVAQAEQDQRLRCSRGQLDACDPATRAILEKQAADAAQQRQAMQAAQAAQARMVEEKQAADAACQVTPSCLADNICEYQAARAKAQRDIAVERANPGGVVDLATLHDLGQDIQTDSAAIASLKPQYAAYAHAQFNEATCAAGNGAAWPVRPLDGAGRVQAPRKASTSPLLVQDGGGGHGELREWQRSAGARRPFPGSLGRRRGARANRRDAQRADDGRGGQQYGILHVSESTRPRRAGPGRRVSVWCASSGQSGGRRTIGGQLWRGGGRRAASWARPSPSRWARP